MELALRGLIVFIILVVACSALIGVADQIPYKEFSGSIIAAAGTIFAGWLAWQAVYRQTRIQGAQAAIELLKIVEQDAKHIAGEKEILVALWSATLQLREQFSTKKRSMVSIQYALDEFSRIDDDRLSILTARVTQDAEIRLARLALHASLTFLQSTIIPFLKDKTYYTDEVMDEGKARFDGDLHKFETEIKRLLDSASVEETDLQERARRLRRAANDLPD